MRDLASSLRALLGSGRRFALATVTSASGSTPRAVGAAIGLDIGGRTAEETAVSIAAELVQVRWGGSGRPLSGLDGDIHWTVTDEPMPAAVLP